MSAGLAVALILIVVLAIIVPAGILFVVVRNRSVTHCRTVSGPGYKHDLSQVQYFDHPKGATSQGSEATEPNKPKHEDARSKPLPRCVFCGTALAFGDSKCHKCGREAGEPYLKR